MEKTEWERKYKNRLMVVAMLSEEEAEDIYIENAPSHDYDEDPEKAADRDISFWGL